MCQQLVRGVSFNDLAKLIKRAGGVLCVHCSIYYWSAGLQLSANLSGFGITAVVHDNPFKLVIDLIQYAGECDRQGAGASRHRTQLGRSIVCGGND